MDFVLSFLGRNGFLPHGACFAWTPAVLWTMVVSDAVIALAYFSIPLAILSFVRKRPEIRMNGLPWLFSGFIFACGITHVMDVWTIWQPDYGWQAVTKAVTAAVSLATAIAVWPLIPKALKIPSVSALQSVIGSLEAEVQKRRSAEEHLYDTQQSLAVTLAMIGAGFIATDRAGRVTRMNSVAEQVTGWTEAEALGSSLWQVFDREGRPAHFLGQNPVDVVIAQTGPGRVTDSVQRVVAVSRSGQRTSLEIKVALTLGDDGAVRGMAMVFRDMTRLIEAEAVTNRLAAIVESSSDAIIGKTLDGRITSWNSAAESMFGYRADEIVGQPVEVLIPPERRHEAKRMVAQLALGHKVPPFTTTRRTRDGRLLDVSLSVSPIRNAQGAIIGASKIARDVTHQLRAEAALHASDARLRFTLESAQIGDWELDLLTGETSRSLRHDRCFGYTELQPHWSHRRFVRHLHPDDRAAVWQAVSRAIRQRSHWNVECRVIWPDASTHWISLHGVVQDDGKRMLGIVVDITAQRQAEEARLTANRLEAENRQIQEANRLKSQFLANMSHELRTPLNAVIGFADLLRSGAVPPQSNKHREFLGHIGTSGRHLLQLINDVLDLSKVESGKFEFFPEPVHLPQLIGEVANVLLNAVQSKRIDLRIEIEPGVEGLRLDPARLKQVLYNYLSNAIKFTTAGGHVTVRALAQGPTHFRLEVEDDGIGIALHDQARLFMEFTQLDAGYNKQHAGTGLGLSLTRRLVQAQGGSVGVRSKLGEGSTFFLVLARDVPAAGHTEAAAAASSARKLLVIDDDDHRQAQLVSVGSQAGFVVDAVASGEQAVERARSDTYRAMTLGLTLPDAPGLGVLARIRHQGASRDCAVVGLSMSAPNGSAANFAIADVLHKPIKTDEIATAMARLRSQAPDGSRMRIMVIDDDPLALELMQTTLVGLGLEVVGLLDGREALRDMDQHAPDAIVLDLMMPGMDGFEVLDHLNRLPRWRSTPVFIWTSMVLTDDEYALLSRSARAIVSKGGGAFESMLESLRRWRPASLALPEGDEP